MLNEPPPAVIYAMQQKNTVVFAGAGLSAEAGLPTAGHLASHLESMLNNLRVDVSSLSDRNLQTICQLYETRIGRGHLTNAVEAMLSTVSLSEISHAHFLLAALVKHGFVNTIIATNYDSLIEDACAAGCTGSRHR